MARLDENLAIEEVASRPRGTLVDRYVVLEQVGAGASGAVYAAYDPDLDRRIALKLRRMSGKREDREAMRERMLREAQAMARLSDRHVVAVHDVGIVGEDVFIAMEFVAGGTLRSWLAAARRTWSEIRAVFVAAGRGLEAAHRAGLVHRDFKPDNVMIGDDGRVAVTDLGLARAIAPDPEVVVDGAALVETVIGGVVGTPAYMAPEQLRGEVATAASDQFGYCVALYEAVRGERPFRGATIAELHASIAGSPFASSVAMPRDLPAQLARVLQRGLAVDPAGRYPSMTALLADLAPTPRRRWGRALLACAAAATVFGGISIARTDGAATEAPCEDGPSEIATVWNLERRLVIDAAFRRTGAVYADAAARTVAEAGDRYAGAWAAGYAEACRATRVTGAQPEGVLDLRMRCLRSRRRDLAALVTLLARADREIVASGAQAMFALRSIDDCADLDALASPVPPPSDPATAARLDALEVQLGEVTASRTAGKYRDALPLAVAVARDAAALGYAPFEGRALLALAEVQRQVGDWAAAVATFERAGAAADRGHDDVSRGHALIGRVRGVSLAMNRTADAKPLEDEVAAIVARAGDRRLSATHAFLRGKLRLMDGSLDEAVAHLVRALREYEALDGPDAFSTLTALSELGGLHGRLGHFDEADRLLRRALASTEKLLGPDHPQVAIVVEFLATTQYVRDRPGEARALFQRVLTIRAQALGRDHAETGESHRRLGLTYASLAQYEPALEHLREAHAIAERHPESPQRLALTLVGLGQVYTESEVTPEAALALAGRALAIYRSIDDRRNIPDVLRMIAINEHRLHRDAEALAHLHESIAGWESFLGKEHVSVASSLQVLGELLIDLKRYPEAIVALERAARIRARSPVRLAETQLALGKALWLAGRDRARARELVQAARTFYVGDRVHPRELARADAWLAAH
jgi:eukaryotic-like serine/threonine-protein kinase